MTQGDAAPAYEDLPEVLPIFPLAGALLLPGGRLPLNIFEPRYVAMVQDAISGARLIGMIQPREAALIDSEAQGVQEAQAPEVYRIGCAGRITSFSETRDNKFHITLTGLIRFDVAKELPPLNGYRRVAPDYRRFFSDMKKNLDEIDRQRFLDALGGYFDATGVEGDWSAIEGAENEHLVTSLAMLCPFEAPEKQALLEAVTLSERAGAMTTIMEMAAYTRDGGDTLHH